MTAPSAPTSRIRGFDRDVLLHLHHRFLLRIKANPRKPQDWHRYNQDRHEHDHGLGRGPWDVETGGHCAYHRLRKHDSNPCPQQRRNHIIPNEMNECQRMRPIISPAWKEKDHLL